ncbi:hypothetical protein [uncultured Cellulomonas sp.]|uniref:hypothetical protein n=1 Tax=uncultured Cellulomonas sp. TaxID=189682 RepID=UPI0028EA8C69|nr:hypothetical protein [uncultured Cellulomonas sp.]
MSDDITAALRGFADAQRRDADASAPDVAVEAGGLSRRVTRRRTVRAGSMALTAVAAVGVVVVGTLLAGSRTPEPPALPAPTTTWTSTPAPTPTATPSATPTTPSEPTVWALRAADPMPPGMLESTGPGWNVVRYSAWGEQGEGLLVPATVYLLDPTGHPYVVPTATDPEGWYLQDWLPGGPFVVARSSTDGATHVLDLLTGESGPTLGDDLYSARFAGDGTTDVIYDTSGYEPRIIRVSSEGVPRAESAAFAKGAAGENWIMSPAGSSILVHDVSGPRVITSDGFSSVSLLAPYPDRPDACAAWMWVDEATVLLECVTGGRSAYVLGSPSTEFWLAEVATGSARLLLDMPEAARLGGVWRVGDRLVAGTFGTSEPEAAWWEVTEGGVVPLSAGGDPVVDVVDVRGSELIVVRQQSTVTGVSTTSMLMAVDPVRGSSRPVVEGELAGMITLSVAPSRLARAPHGG